MPGWDATGRASDAFIERFYIFGLPFEYEDVTPFGPGRRRGAIVSDNQTIRGYLRERGICYQELPHSCFRVAARSLRCRLAGGAAHAGAAE
ncbi:MAG: hypothetical protein ABGY42_16900, partial [bacterium]